MSKIENLAKESIILRINFKQNLYFNYIPAIIKIYFIGIMVYYLIHHE